MRQKFTLIFLKFNCHLGCTNGVDNEDCSLPEPTPDYLPPVEYLPPPTQTLKKDDGYVYPVPAKRFRFRRHL